MQRWEINTVLTLLYWHPRSFHRFAEFMFSINRHKAFLFITWPNEQIEIVGV